MTLTNTQTFLFYEVLAVCTSCLYALGKKQVHWLMGYMMIAVAIAIPVFFAAFRFEVGTDYQTYVSIYKIISISDASETSNMYSVLGAGGVGIWVIARLSQFGGVCAFLGLFQLLTIGFYIKALDYYNVKAPFLTMYIYMLTAFPISLNVVKQALAMSIVFFSLKYVFEKKPIKFTVLILLATTIHSTSVIFIPVYLLQRKQEASIQEPDKSRRINWTIQSITLFVLAFAVSFIAPRIVSRIGFFGALSSTYIDNLSGGRNLSFFIQLALFVIIILFSLNLFSIDKKSRLLIWLISIGTGVEAIGFISVVIKRVALFFYLLPMTIIIPMIPFCFTSSDNSRLFAKICIILVQTIIFYISYILLGQGGITPYSIVF